MLKIKFYSFAVIMVNIAIVGLGYWGPNLVRNFSLVKESHVKLLVDMDVQRLQRFQLMYPNIETTDDVEQIFQRSDIDAVVLATPIHTHYTLAKKALQSGKHVLVEKPLATSRDEVTELIDLSLHFNKVLMVDHTFLYTGAVRKIREYIESGEMGDLQYFDSTRINLGLFNPRWSVIWDLAVHDLSIFHYISQGKEPMAVSATGISHTHMAIENMAYISLFFDDNTFAHITSSWVSPVKIRKTLIGGTKKMIIYDDVEPTEKVKIYDSGFTVNSQEDIHRWLVDYRFGDIYIPKLNQTEALKGVAEDFTAAIMTGSSPVSDMYGGLNVVTILEAAQKSMAQKGNIINL